MGAWKTAESGDVDHEAERIDRQKAAFGGDTVARIKDLNVLIVGCGGVGAETAKNIILSNVGSVTLYDPEIVHIRDLGSNFYLRQVDVGVPRAQASLPNLKTLNPYCKVDLTSNLSDEYLKKGTTLGAFSAIVVTRLLPRVELLRLNRFARNNSVAFILSFNAGVTSSIFSDFGSNHEITDANGEPTQMLAISNVEVIDKKPTLLKVSGYEKGDTLVILTVAQSEHGLDDGDLVILDDMRDGMQGLNQKQFPVKRVAFESPSAAQVNAQDISFLEALKQPTLQVMENFQRQYDHYQQEFENNAEKAGQKFPVRTITMFNRLVLVLKEGDTTETFASYESGGLLHQVRPSIFKSYQPLEETLESTTVPQMLRGDDWEAGKGIDVHLSLCAVLDFQEKNNRWPGIHNDKDADIVLELAKSISSARSGKEGTCWSQKVDYGFPTGDERDLDEERVKRFARLFQTELTGFCAFLGGAVAQEVLKKTGKFTPIDQWIHHDEHVLVNDESRSNVGPLFGSRYDHQIAIMGKAFQAAMMEQRVFLVGCGALGCEYLKGLSLMGAATGRDGMIYVTDMDRIEVSNLSRQFLFRDHDVGNPKSVSGARVVKEWNPQLNITALEKKVGPDTEDFFDDSFWESLNLCWNALGMYHFD
jgi:ubiquitin-activating enzyme E1